MKKSSLCARGWILALPTIVATTWTSGVDRAYAQLTNSITYQGRLTDAGLAADGTYDFIFRARTLAIGGVQVGNTVTLGDVDVVNGLFTVDLDFGGAVFAGSRRWLEIAVRPGASAGLYTILSPRQELTATPYSLFSLNSPSQSLDAAYDAGGPGDGRVIAADAGAVRINGQGLILDGPHGTSGTALSIYTQTTGTTLNVHNDSTGRAANFLVNSSSSSNNAVAISTNGNSNSQALTATHTGTGDCALFTITNAENQGEAVEARTNGIGDAVQAVNTGTGRAGLFQIDNAANANTALYAVSNGTGLAFRAEGRVGIGTSTVPVGVLMAVDGKVLCEELEVQLSQDWPDYVFEPEYKLMPLDQLERKVREDGHLPGIPSAKTVSEKKGIAVGDMQARLLEKVEELTLYVIDVNKEVKSLQQENTQLRQRLAALESGKQ